MYADEREMAEEWWGKDAVMPEAVDDPGAEVAMHDHRAAEAVWFDVTEEDLRCRIGGYTTVHSEQPQAPRNIAALIEVGRRNHAFKHDKVIEAEGVFLTPQQAIEAGLLLLESAWSAIVEEHPNEGPINRMSHDQRWRAHVIAAGLQDMTFWVHEDPDHPPLYVATEVETGVSAWGFDAQDAMTNYFGRGYRSPEEVLAGAKSEQATLAQARVSEGQAIRRGSGAFQALVEIRELLSEPGNRAEALAATEAALAEYNDSYAAPSGERDSS